MGRVYMDLSEETHQKFLELAKKDKRTLKGFLEVCVNNFIGCYTTDILHRKEVKKDHGKKRK